ncbi:HET-domain-containing protein [Fusarium sp. LHS14.1]|nr:HET-domain-containing protein [Fusarium sp. LHS14.1]
MDRKSIYNTRLDSKQGEVRFLTLHPSKGAPDEDRRVSCSLTRANLNSGMRFNALSYVWGDASHRETILINGIEVQVTRNLESALRRLSVPGQYGELQTVEVPLWVDAVCINQGDIEERNESVSKMADIYNRADKVVVWLGEGNRDLDFALTAVQDKSFIMRIHGLKTEPFEPYTKEDLRILLVLLEDIGKMPWWRRIWVVQEVVLAKSDPVFVCGRNILLWTTYCLIFNSYIRDRVSTSIDFIPVAEQVSGPSTLQAISSCIVSPIRRMRHSESRPSRVILSALQDHLATNPRDHIYGCIGLITTPEKSLIQVDYRKSPIEVWTEAMAIIWNDVANLQLIDNISFYPFESSTNPSQVPNFSAQSKNGMNPERYNGSSLIARSPNFGWGSSHTPTISRENVLCVQGITCDQIGYVSETARLRKHLKEPPSWLRDMESQAQAVMDCQQSSKHVLQNLDFLREIVKRQDQASIIKTLTDYPWLEGMWFQGMENNAAHLWEIFFGRAKIPEEVFTELSKLPKDGSEVALFAPLSLALYARLEGRKFFTTMGGLLGVGPPSIRKGDLIVFIFGTRVPMILRPRVPGEGYRLVGFAYVAGLSEINLSVELHRRGCFTETTFEIY